MGISYSVDADPDETAKAMLRERHMSHKHSKEIAREIKGMTAGEAVDYLESVTATTSTAGTQVATQRGRRRRSSTCSGTPSATPNTRASTAPR